MRKGSKEAKAWGAKMRRLRGTKKRKKTKSTTQKRRSTRKGQRRKTARRAYTGLKRRVSRRKNSSSSAWNF